MIGWQWIIPDDDWLATVAMDLGLGLFDMLGISSWEGDPLSRSVSPESSPCSPIYPPTSQGGPPTDVPDSLRFSFTEMGPHTVTSDPEQCIAHSVDYCHMMSCNRSPGNPTHEVGEPASKWNVLWFTLHHFCLCFRLPGCL